MPTEQIELAPRSDGARYRRVTLAVEGDGGVVLHSHEMGPGADAGWLDDEEITLSVPSDQVGRLAMALAAELLKGGKDAVGRLAAICEDHNVPSRTSHWS
jgi:hypothetical protein